MTECCTQLRHCKVGKQNCKDSKDLRVRLSKISVVFKLCPPEGEVIVLDTISIPADSGGMVPDEMP